MLAMFVVMPVPHMTARRAPGASLRCLGKTVSSGNQAFAGSTTGVEAAAAEQ
jgi:hypothetical protein